MKKQKNYEAGIGANTLAHAGASGLVGLGDLVEIDIIRKDVRLTPETYTSHRSVPGKLVTSFYLIENYVSGFADENAEKACGYYVGRTGCCDHPDTIELSLTSNRRLPRDITASHTSIPLRPQLIIPARLIGRWRVVEKNMDLRA